MSRSEELEVRLQALVENPHTYIWITVSTFSSIKQSFKKPDSSVSPGGTVAGWKRINVRLAELWE